MAVSALSSFINQSQDPRSEALVASIANKCRALLMTANVAIELRRTEAMSPRHDYRRAAHKFDGQYRCVGSIDAKIGHTFVYIQTNMLGCQNNG